MRQQSYVRSDSPNHRPGLAGQQQEPQQQQRISRQFSLQPPPFPCSPQQLPPTGQRSFRSSPRSLSPMLPHQVLLQVPPPPHLVASTANTTTGPQTPRLLRRQFSVQPPSTPPPFTSTPTPPSPLSPYLFPSAVPPYSQHQLPRFNQASLPDPPYQYQQQQLYPLGCPIRPSSLRHQQYQQPQPQSPPPPPPTPSFSISSAYSNHLAPPSPSIGHQFRPSSPAYHYQQQQHSSLSRCSSIDRRSVASNGAGSSGGGANTPSPSLAPYSVSQLVQYADSMFVPDSPHKTSNGPRAPLHRMQATTSVGTPEMSLEQREAATVELNEKASERCKTYCRELIAFLFSHLGLCLLVIGYMLMGAAIFQELESDPTLHLQVPLKAQVLKNETLSRLFNKIRHLSVFTDEQIIEIKLSKELNQELADYTRRMVEHIGNGYDPNLAQGKSGTVFTCNRKS